MSHVDEGTLHAYLDGELPPSERAAVESHLAQCATCRATLAEERVLLERASALLGSARPVERPAPPFEQLRQARRHSPWRVRMPLAWAASLALALGLGYYLRNPDGTVTTTPEPRTVSVAQDRSVTAPASAQEEKATPTVVRQHTRDRESARASDQLAASAPGVTGASGAVAMQPSGSVRTESPARQASPPVALQEVVVTGTPAPAAPRPRESAVASWPVIDRGTAAALLGENPVGLPGLPIRKLRLSPGLDRTVLVEQALDSTAVIQVFQRVASVGARSETSGHARDRADEPGRASRLARFMGRLRVEIAGPVSPDSLNRLLEQIVPLP